MFREIWNEISHSSQPEYPMQSKTSYLNKEFVLYTNFSEVQTKSRDCHLLTKRRVATGTRKRNAVKQTLALTKSTGILPLPSAESRSHPCSSLSSPAKPLHALVKPQSCLLYLQEKTSDRTRNIFSQKVSASVSFS